MKKASVKKVINSSGFTSFEVHYNNQIFSKCLYESDATQRADAINWASEIEQKKIPFLIDQYKGWFKKFFAANGYSTLNQGVDFKKKQHELDALYLFVDRK